jgi:cytochrome b subunit of formate dehydrogenase
VSALLKLLYWVAVVAISVALVIGLILWFESQDASELEKPSSGGSSVTSLA